jgi:stage II sporulation SpoE-like protein
MTGTATSLRVTLGWRERARLARERLLSPRSLTSDPVVLVASSAVIVACGVAQVALKGYIPMSALTVPFLIAALLLGTRALIFLDVVAAATTLFIIVRLGIGPHGARIGAAMVIAATAGFAHLISGSRERLGVKGLRSEAMLVDLRHRLTAHGRIPDLPGDWHVEVMLRAAGGSAFGGDFVVSALSDDGKRLEVAVVDVSGKGIEAGTRALQLSGALGGLIGSLPPREFLPAASSYLLRQGWTEGFATAVHATIDLTSGEFTVDSAGHPPAVHFDAGSGRWRPLAAEGPMLGLMQTSTFTHGQGLLRGGDALILYTDGLIEVPGRDIDIGVDKLLGEAERLLPVGFGGGARRLVDAVAPDGSDDRAVVMLWRN